MDLLETVCREAFEKMKVNDAAQILIENFHNDYYQLTGVQQPGHQVLKSFYATYAEDIDKNKVDDMTKLFYVFARSGWDNMSVINSFI